MRAPRCQGDGGAVIIEAAMALPILAVLMLGMLDFGMAWHESIVLDRAMAVAARTGSNLGSNPLADFETLRSLEAGLSDLQGSSITRVVIYRANNSQTGDLPPACVGLVPVPSSTSPLGSTGANCNVYSAAQVEAQTPSGFGTDAGCAPTDWDRFWCPADERDNGDDDFDFLGLYVELEYDTFTGLTGNTLTIERSAVYALEPDSAFGG